MNADFCTHDHLHLIGDSATHPIEPRCGALGSGAAGRAVEASRVTDCGQQAGPFNDNVGDNCANDLNVAAGYVNWDAAHW